MARLIAKSTVFVALLLLAISTEASTSSAPETTEIEIQFDSKISPVGNLFYHIECLGKRIRCSQSAYRDLWQELGPLTEEDQLAIRRFSNVLDVYGFRAQLGSRFSNDVVSEGRFGAEIVDIGPLPTQSFSLLNRVRLAAYGSANPDELSERLGLFMHPDDVATLTNAVALLWPRFLAWWGAEASGSLLKFEEGLSEILEEQNRDTLPSVATLFGIPPTSGSLILTVHLVAHPQASAATSAEIIENHAIVEVLADESPTTRAGVIVHELVHYLFAIAPKAVHDIRLEGALRSENPRAAAALGLMNEAIATAIGNGIVEEQIRGDSFTEYFQKDGSFYARPEIDTAAKSIYALVKEYLNDQRTIDNSFADRYYSLVSEAVGPNLDSLSSRLRVSAYVATDEPLAQAMRNVPRLLGMNSLYGSTLDHGETVTDSVLYRHPYLNGVVLLREENRSMAGQFLPEASQKIDSLMDGSFHECIFTRPSGSSIFFLVIDSPEPNAQLLVDRMNAATACNQS